MDGDGKTRFAYIYLIIPHSGDRKDGIMFNFRNIYNAMSIIILAICLVQGMSLHEVSFLVAFLGYFKALFALCDKAERAGGLKAF